MSFWPAWGEDDGHGVALGHRGDGDAPARVHVGNHRVLAQGGPLLLLGISRSKYLSIHLNCVREAFKINQQAQI